MPSPSAPCQFCQEPSHWSPEARGFVHVSSGEAECQPATEDAPRTAPALHRVTILGPNLPRPLCDRGDMHAHAAGCRDIGRYPFDDRARSSRGWTIDAADWRTVVEETYGDQMHDYDPPAPWTDYAHDIARFPCLADLPDDITAEAVR